jgi:hypothetical protein
MAACLLGHRQLVGLRPGQRTRVARRGGGDRLLVGVGQLARRQGERDQRRDRHRHPNAKDGLGPHEPPVASVHAGVGLALAQ